MHDTTRTTISLLLLAGAATAQQWTPIATHPRYRVGQAMAADPLTMRPLLFGGSGVYNWFGTPVHDADTWRWNGDSWYRLDTASAPPANGPGIAMALDLQRHRTVLFAAEPQPSQTWEWDGRTWLQRQPATSPPGSVLACAMAYDAFRGRTVLYDTAAGNETWEWDGSNWTLIATPSSPGQRFGFRLAFDLIRGKTVLFGGDDGSRQHLVLNDTWEYDGANWTQVQPAVSPPGRNEHTMAWDGTQVLLYGGRNGATLLNDTWQYDGATWTQASTSTLPLQVEPQMAYDAVANRTVLFTAFDTGLGAVPQTWSWDGTNWTLETMPSSPPVREMHGLADDAHGRMLLFGGYNAAISGLGGSTFHDTWLFDGAHWQQATPLNSPPSRAMFGIATDTVRQRVVMFGGEDASLRLGDTWEWDGANWTLASSSGPQPRSRMAMAFDAARGVTVLHGGDDGSQSLADTWTFNGSAWQQAPAAAGTPGQRTDHAMSFDAASNLVVLYGGQSPSGDSNDVWDWNGAQWQQRLATTPPAPRHFHDFTYDAARQRFVLHGGADPSTATETFEWDGASTWTPITAGAQPGTATAAGAAYDARLHRVLLWDGSALWAFTAHAADSSAYGSGCGNPTTPLLLAAGRPYIGNALFACEALQLGQTNLALLFADFATDSTPIGGGCTVLLAAPQLLSLQFADNAGVARFPTPIPVNAALVGLQLYTQTAELDALTGIELSNGLRLSLGD